MERMSDYKKEFDLACEKIVKLEKKIKKLEFDVDAWHQLKLLLEGEIEKLKEENKKLKNYINLIEGTVRFKDV